jgi:hypothetical protein
VIAEPGTASCRRGDVEIDVANADCDPAGAGAGAGAADGVAAGAAGAAAAADGAGKDAGGGVRAGVGLVVGGPSAAVNAYCVVEGRVPAFFKTPRTI